MKEIYIDTEWGKPEEFDEWTKSTFNLKIDKRKIDKQDFIDRWKQIVYQQVSIPKEFLGLKHMYAEPACGCGRKDCNKNEKT
jgi:hypothetical protein